MTAPTESATLVVGTFPLYQDGPSARMTVTIELQTIEAGWQTTDHKTTDHKTTDGTEYRLSVCGEAKRPGGAYSGGQNRDDLAAVLQVGTPAMDRNDLASLLAIWERWHLNDLQAGCVHQDHVPHNVADWTASAAAESAKCPNGYRYGSAWLVTPLPADVVAEVRRLMALGK